jgi:hypothetical protein
MIFHEICDLTLFYFSLLLFYVLDRIVTTLSNARIHILTTYVETYKTKVIQKTNQLNCKNQIEQESLQTSNNRELNQTDENRLSAFPQCMYRICIRCYQAACTHTSILEDITDINSFSEDLPCAPCTIKLCIHYQVGYEPFVPTYLMLKLPNGYPIRYQDQPIRDYYYRQNRELTENQVENWDDEPLNLTVANSER